MTKSNGSTHRLIGYIVTLAVANLMYVSAHLTRNECIQGTGCISGKNGGTATFNFTAATTASPVTHSGTLTYVDASAGINITSSTLVEYAEGATPSERLLSYQLSGDTYSEARLFVSDGGPSTADSFRIQLLDSSSIPVFENGGTLQAGCGAGIAISATCQAQAPCELTVTAACLLLQPGSNPSTSGCTITGNTAEVDFIYTIRNTGTVPISLAGLTGSDSFGPLDLSSLSGVTLQPGQETTVIVREMVTGPFPFVNTVTLTTGQNAANCSDMASITINRQTPTPEPPDDECPDFVTGGGWIIGTPLAGKANFGIHGGIKNGGLWGGLNYLDHKAGLHVKSTGVTGYTSLSDLGRQINFNVTINGAAGTAVVKLQDSGEPGRNDRFEIQLSTGYSAGGDLGGAGPGGGNIQLHKGRCDRDDDDGEDNDNCPHRPKCQSERDCKDKDRDDDDDGEDKDRDNDDKGKGKDRDDDDDGDKGDKDQKNNCPHSSKCKTDSECKEKSDRDKDSGKNRDRDDNDKGKGKDGDDDADDQGDKARKNNCPHSSKCETDRECKEKSDRDNGKGKDRDDRDNGGRGKNDNDDDRDSGKGKSGNDGGKSKTPPKRK